MAKAKDILKRIKDEEIDWVDLRFTDPKGKWQHLTMVASVIGEDELEDGLMFDGSSIEGWKAINESDMILMPDLDSVYIDPFSATPMMIINCDIVEPSTGDLYSRDPRSTAKRAEAYLKSTGIGDTVYVGPEAEFFLSSTTSASMTATMATASRIDDIELPTNSNNQVRNRQPCAPSACQGRLLPGRSGGQPASTCAAKWSPPCLKWACPATSITTKWPRAQHELGLTFGTLVQTADRMQVYKYVVHQVAQAYGKTATFMPKPIMKDNGSGMHTHISIWEGRQADVRR